MEEPPKFFDDLKSGDELIWFNEREKILSQNEKSKYIINKNLIHISPRSINKSKN
jgi:hypothetical protein